MKPSVRHPFLIFSANVLQVEGGQLRPVNSKTTSSPYALHVALSKRVAVDQRSLPREAEYNWQRGVCCSAWRCVLNISKMVRCQRCGVDVAEHNLSRHVHKIHSPTAEAKRAVAQLAVRLEAKENKERRDLLRSPLTCPACKQKVRLGDIKSHFGNVHSSPAPAMFLAQLGEKPPSNRFRSARDREQYWRRHEQGEEPERSEDLFDKTKVLQGGLFGLGKNRRH